MKLQSPKEQKKSSLTKRISHFSYFFLRFSLETSAFLWNTGSSHHAGRPEGGTGSRASRAAGSQSLEWEAKANGEQFERPGSQHLVFLHDSKEKSVTLPAQGSSRSSEWTLPFIKICHWALKPSINWPQKFQFSFAALTYLPWSTRNPVTIRGANSR